MALRIAIAGTTKGGKSTVANYLGDALGVPVQHTDDLISTHEWSAASLEVSQRMTADGPWIIEGVAVVRALRKWLAANPDGKPCDVLYWLTAPHVELTKGQDALRKGCLTVWAEIAVEVEARGVVVLTDARAPLPFGPLGPQIAAQFAGPGKERP